MARELRQDLEHLIALTDKSVVGSGWVYGDKDQYLRVVERLKQVLDPMNRTFHGGAGLVAALLTGPELWQFRLGSTDIWATFDQWRRAPLGTLIGPHTEYRRNVLLKSSARPAPTASSDHPAYVSVTHGMRGHFAVLMTWNTEGAFYEPWQSSPSAFESPERAVDDGKSWAKAEGIEFK
jgi:hypothetical protein